MLLRVVVAGGSVSTSDRGIVSRRLRCGLSAFISFEVIFTISLICICILSKHGAKNAAHSDTRCSTGTNRCGIHALTFESRL